MRIYAVALSLLLAFALHGCDDGTGSDDSGRTFFNINLDDDFYVSKTKIKGSKAALYCNNANEAEVPLAEYASLTTECLSAPIKNSDNTGPTRFTNSAVPGSLTTMKSIFNFMKDHPEAFDDYLSDSALETPASASFTPLSADAEYITVSGTVTSVPTFRADGEYENSIGGGSWHSTFSSCSSLGDCINNAISNSYYFDSWNGVFTLDGQYATFYPDNCTFMSGIISDCDYTEKVTYRTFGDRVEIRSSNKGTTYLSYNTEFDELFIRYFPPVGATLSTKYLNEAAVRELAERWSNIY